MITSWQKILIPTVLFGWLFSASFANIYAQPGIQACARIDAYAVAVEDGNYIYLAGNAVGLSGQLPVGSLNQGGGMLDIWVAKLQKDGTPVFQAVIGGSADESAYAISVRQGVMYIFGETWSSDFPGAPGNAGENDALVFALAADGSQTLWANRFGGSDQDSGRAIAILGNDLYMTGITWSQDFLPESWKGNADGFLLRTDLSGDVKWVQEFGGSALDAPFSLAVQPGQIWLAGQTFSSNLAGPSLGYGDVFVLRFDENGVQKFAGLYGGPGEDVAYAAALASDGSLYLAGDTQSEQMTGAKGRFVSGTDSFVMRIAKNGNLQMTSYIGGSGQDSSTSLVVLPNGNIAVTGRTQSEDFPSGWSLAQPNPSGQNAFLVQLNPSGDVVSNLLTGGDHDPRGMAVLTDGLVLSGSFGGGITGYLLLIPAADLPGWSSPTAAPKAPAATNAPTATVRPTETPVKETSTDTTATVTNPSGTITPSPTVRVGGTQEAEPSSMAAVIQSTETLPAVPTQIVNEATAGTPASPADPDKPAIPVGLWLAGGAGVVVAAGGLLYSVLRKKKSPNQK